MPRALAVSLLLACSGPAAPDEVLCEDFAERLCVAPLCLDVSTSFGVTADTCVATLEQRLGCGADDFAFTTPSRTRVLDCRVPLMRAGDQRGSAPSCDDISDVFVDCPDVTSLLKPR
jgi:hypothetical protein